MLNAKPNGRAFGLDIYSDQDISNLINPISDEKSVGEIFIREGSVPVRLSNGKRCGALCEANADSFLLHIPDIATYYVTADGITMTIASNGDRNTAQLFLFGSAIGALLHLRKIIALHASAVRLENGTAAIFCGASTSGKSTLAAALKLAGLDVLADDITAVQFDDKGNPWVYPGLARSKLWANTIQLLGLADDEIKAHRVTPEMDKYFVSGSLYPHPVRLSHVFEISIAQQKNASITPISGKQKLETLINHTYRSKYLKALGRDIAHMHSLFQIASKVNFSRISRPQSSNTIPQIVDTLKSVWQ